jgi:hypothetical protein
LSNGVKANSTPPKERVSAAGDKGTGGGFIGAAVGIKVGMFAIRVRAWKIAPLFWSMSQKNG